MSTTNLILLFCLCVPLITFLSAATGALKIFSMAKLQQALEKRNKNAHLADKIADNSEKLNRACDLWLLVVTLAALLIVVVLWMRLSDSGTKIYTAILTSFGTIIMFTVFGLAIPRAWAKYAGEILILKTYKLLTVLALVCWPLLYIFQLFDIVIKRLAGVTEAVTEAQKQDQMQEEFLTSLEQHKIEGAVDAEEQEMIENVLELADTNADEIMTPRIDLVAIEENSNLETIVKIINTDGHSRMPVYRKNIDNIIGFIYAKDLLINISAETKDFDLHQKMRKPYFVPETKSLRELLHEFQNQKLHIAVVLDEYGGTAGIVTLEDILEELVGEITDEYEDTQPEDITTIDEHTVEVDARTYVDDINDQLNLNLPEDEDYDTIGGFVLSHLGYIPLSGESFEYKNIKFSITSAETRKINRIQIYRSASSDAK